ncbi:MAG: class I SAM-dependent methyltransferase [Phycisphaerae bacterium]
MTPSPPDTARASFPQRYDRALACPNCGGEGMTVFYEVDGIPVHSCLMVPTRQEALDFRTGDLRLGFCSACGFVSNTAFQPEVHSYGVRYEESQGSSPRFNEFLEHLVGRLISRYGIRRKTVLEIGCGKGGFLVRMCEVGDNRGIGIDPSCAPERIHTAAPITWIREFYGPQHAGLGADVICCRHTLEHIGPTRQFLLQVRRAIGQRQDTLVFFELPDAMRILREGAIWDIYYEHCSYFSTGSLARLFRGCGLDLLEMELDYGGQYILLVARPAGPKQQAALEGEDDMPQLIAAVDTFPANAQSQIRKWGDTIRQAAAAGRKVALWAAGSKCVAFLTTLKLGDEVRCVVDVSPYKQGSFITGTGHQVVAPDELARVRPDLVIAMNPIYVREIQRELDRMGLPSRLTAV